MPRLRRAEGGGWGVSDILTRIRSLFRAASRESDPEMMRAALSYLKGLIEDYEQEIRGDSPDPEKP